MHTRASHCSRQRRRIGIVAALFGFVLLAGCGHGHHHDGDIVVDNRTDLTTPEDLLTFRIAPFGQPFSGDLLGGTLVPLSSRLVGTFREDYYDAEGDLQGGGIIEWFDIFVGDGDTTVFEVR